MVPHSDNIPGPSGNRTRSNLNQESVRRMSLQQRARYMAYQEPHKEAKVWMDKSRKRVSAWRSTTVGGKRPTHIDPETEGETEKTRQDLITGQLKAAEARNRLRQMRLKYQCMRAKEINLMISGQDNAQTAIRLELLLSTEQSNTHTKDCLDKLQRKRVEEILEDIKGLTINRT
ncbi:hypothetical protein DPEC_G00016060 [Dallia pectoralis]|uniref:Uncharacterized protein n=1 Tax=Dallia pectoralis TaxID=75939 RepID=A0ACC2HMR8_DALPE|nr:hypothetical protein DPEC_G00016060 [Dallia pectoralis]